MKERKKEKVAQQFKFDPIIVLDINYNHTIVNPFWFSRISWRIPLDMSIPYFGRLAIEFSAISPMTRGNLDWRPEKERLL